MVVFLSDIAADVRDFFYSLAKPFADIKQDIRDVKSAYSKKRLNKKIINSVLQQYPTSPSSINFLQRAAHLFTYHIARLEALHQTPHISREFLMKELLPKTTEGAPFLSSLPTLISNPFAVGATAIGATVGIFTVCKTCRVKTNRFCETLFHCTSAIGKQTRNDFALIAHSIARMAQTALPKKSRTTESHFAYIPFEETIALFSNIFFKWIPASTGMTNDKTLKGVSRFSSNGNDSAHLPKHPRRRSTSFWKKNYALEFVVLSIIFGTIGVFMSIYADTTSNRSNMPIAYQGRLMDASYIPKSDNTYYLAFEIYSASSGGTCKWRTETTQDGSCAGSDLTALSATTSRGLFTVVLGNGDANNPSFGFNFDTSTSYLQVYVCPSATPGTTGSCETLSPRKQIAGVTYAYNSDLLDGINYDGFLQLAPGTSAQTLTFTGTTTNALTLSATSLSSGKGVVITGPSSGTAGVTSPILDITSDIGHLGGSSGLVKITGTIDTTTSPGIGTSLYISTTNSNSTNANTAYGIYETLSDTIALANSNYGMYIDVSNSGAHTSGTKSVYGEYISALSNGSNGGNTNAYGLYITGKTIQGVNDSSTANYYGLYVANDSNGNQGYGTSTKYGLYVDSQSGADTNYSAIFAGGNVGIGNTAPGSLLTVGSSSTRGVLALIGTSSSHPTFQIDDTNYASGKIFNIYSGFNSAGEFAIFDVGANATRLSIDTNGNVGIATVDPSNTLDVASSAIVATRGSEKTTNGSFTGNATGWTLNTGWTYSSNMVNKDSDGTGTLTQDVTETAGETYAVSFTISSYTTGNVTVSLGGATGTVRSAAGRYTEILAATTTTDLAFTPSSTARFTIDEITIKKLTGGNLYAMGNVGIGTAAPGTNLHIGTGTEVASWFVSGEQGLLVAPNTSVARLAISGTSQADLLLYDGDANTDIKTFRIKNDAGFVYFDATNDAFTSIPYRMMTFDLSTSNVGIGTTAPDTKLHVTGDFDGSSAAGTTDLNKGLTIQKKTGIGSDYALNDLYGIAFTAISTTDADYPVAAVFAEVTQSDSTYLGGNLRFLTKTGAEASLSTKMLIDKGGNVGIGTITPYSALQVSGYIQMYQVTSAPASGDCDASTELGRSVLYTDTGTYTNYYYVCSQTGASTYGWKRVTLGN